MEKSIHGGRSALSTLLAAWVAAALVIAGAVVLWQWQDIPVGDLTRDPADTLDAPAYLGTISGLGIVLWAATATVCLFSAWVIWKRDGRPRWSMFLAASGVLSLVLLADDMLLLHDRIFPHSLGFPELAVFTTYGVIAIAYAVVFRREIYRTEFVTLLLAAAFFGLSIVSDRLTNATADTSFKFLIEDGFKLFGIFTWFVYYLRVCIGTFLSSPVSSTPDPVVASDPAPDQPAPVGR